ncbi:MAG TPA: glycosyltransferase [Candidatus Limnocylindrales bacterium]|nr:glycosyltransferase [Candidatus Limnocylindrales bacterium]
MLLELVFWTASLLFAWVYVGYPLLVAAIGRLRPIRLVASDPTPSLAVAIAVHDEAAHIADRIADVFAQESSGATIHEVLVGSDGSTDGTDEIVARLAASEPRLRLLSLPRSGTTPAQHAMFEAARADVVLLTDAETRFAPGCLAALVEAFRDPRVGCATGRLEWAGEDVTATSRNEGLYWRYERRVRALESRAGFLTAGTGAILAVRRACYRPVTSTTGMDHLLPLFVLEQRRLVVFVADAAATDRPITGLREQFRNRARTATRGIEANLSMAGRLAPWSHPRAALAVWSHKVLRWSTPWLVLAAAGSGAVLAVAGRTSYAIAPLAVLAGGVAAIVAHAISRTGRKPPRPIAFARAFAVVSLAFALGWWNVLRGRRIEAWHRADWHARP